MGEICFSIRESSNNFSICSFIFIYQILSGLGTWYHEIEINKTIKVTKPKTYCPFTPLMPSFLHKNDRSALLSALNGRFYWFWCLYLFCVTSMSTKSYCLNEICGRVIHCSVMSLLNIEWKLRVRRLIYCIMFVVIITVSAFNRLSITLRNYSWFRHHLNVVFSFRSRVLY